MRTARAEDYWRKSAKKEYSFFLQAIDLRGFIGINEIQFGKGIRCITGLNGVGKSTIVAAVKAIIGLPCEIKDIVKIEGQVFQGKFVYNGKEYICENSDGKTLFEQIDIDDQVVYIDADKAIKILDYYLKQENLEELIEQNEARELKEEEIKDINYIVGRDYKQISLCEITDIEGFGTIPYFIVSEADNQYDSRKMGLGEHFLFYSFWALFNSNSDSYVIIEEPETFIGIRSQQGIMDLIAKLATKRGCSFLITTHSPYILDSICDENISIVARASGLVSICCPRNGISVGSFLGYKELIEGTLLVEDELAELFLECLLESETPGLRKNYNVEIAGSDSEISNYLKLICTNKIKYRFIGIYDGDRKGKIAEGAGLKWPHTFLPVTQDVEMAIIDFLNIPDNIKMFAESLNKDVDSLTVTLNMVSGEDKHDKVLNVIRSLAVDKKYFVRKFYDLWKPQNAEGVNLFISQLYDCMG